jgi:peptide/nickel transport system substrate-binding protein
MDRINYLCNLTGEQGETDTSYGVSDLISLYMWPDETPVLNSTEIISEYQVKFVLNKPYGVWLPLLTFTGSMMLDPEVTPADDYICEGMSGATSETISGTGPWRFDYTIAGVETQFSRNDDFWRGPGQIEKLVFSVIQDSDARNTAMLNGDVHVLDAPHPSYYAEMGANKDLFLYAAGPGTITQYLGMNNKLYNITVRSAISYAIDYDYMINNLLEGEAVRLKSPIPLGIQYANWSYEVPTLNLTKAREYMQSMGYGVGFTSDSQWIAASFITVNYTYNLDNQFRIDMLTLLQDNLGLIGIDVTDNGLEWSLYKAYLQLPISHNKLSIWFIGWMPDYNDPSNYANSLMSNISSSNTAQINDPLLESYLLAGLEETDQNVRKQIYWDMQKYCVEVLRPWAFGYVSLNHDVWIKELHGYPSNGMGYNYFYPCYFA